jgi:sulfide dehydrogenase [flavocytochrome c] flavoprotein subunit
VAPGYAFSLKGIYQPKDDQYAEAEVTTSPVEASREMRQREADEALTWFARITGDAFG